MSNNNVCNLNSMLVIDDDKSIRELIAEALKDEGYDVKVAKNASEALKIVESTTPSLVLLDIWLEGSEMDGLGLLMQIKKINPNIIVIMITGHGNAQIAVKAIKGGAWDFIEKPFKIERLLITVSRALETQKLYLENNDLRQETDIGISVITAGSSRAIINLRKDCEKLGPPSSRVLIIAPHGSCEGLIAFDIHNKSPRAKRPFVVVSCVGIEDPKKLSEELFGREDEAGTVKKIGALEKAAGGTVFIDAIELMHDKVQQQLLATLQSGSFVRINGDDAKPIEFNVRIISASSSNLEELVEQGNFGKSLFYRLNIALLKVPALKDRKEDIEELSNIFIKQLSKEMERAPIRLSAEAISVMQSYSWPGNIRQLRNVIEWMLIVHGGATPMEISPDMLPDYILSSIGRQCFGFSMDTKNLEIFNKPLREARGLFERQYIEAQLERFGYNVSRTADYIGMDRTALHRKIKHLSVNSPDRRSSANHFNRKKPINSNFVDEAETGDIKEAM